MNSSQNRQKRDGEKYQMLLQNVHISLFGAIDGKHIRVTKFPHSGSMNLNYKCYFSIVLIAIADSDYKFTYVDIWA